MTTFFKPAWQTTLLLAALAAAFASLGNWQLQRAAGKERLLADYDNAPRLERLSPTHKAARFSRLGLTGSFDAQRTVLVDNRILNGRAGVHALTPFTTKQGETLLVNRGWLPLGPDRRTLPAVPTRADEQTIAGYLDQLAPPGRQLGEADQLDPSRWPQLVTYPELGTIAAALETPLYPMILMLDADSPGGFDGRDWAPVFMTPAKHRGYALQWFALSLTAFVIWVVLALRRARLLEKGISE